MWQHCTTYLGSWPTALGEWDLIIDLTAQSHETRTNFREAFRYLRLDYAQTQHAF